MIKNLCEQPLCIGVEKQRAYYVPFSASQDFSANRQDSELFLSLNGKWQFGAYEKIEDVDLANLESGLTGKIDVPSCVEYYGCDYFQYTNIRYAIPYNPPEVPVQNPAYHYRRDFALNKSDLSKTLYLNFEGVDACFYLYINGQFVGFSQISHRISEFNISKFVVEGENVIDVFVQKWCFGTYLEDQDKWRFTGIFRDVYILKRAKSHITDYKVDTYLKKGKGVIEFTNVKGSAVTVSFDGQSKQAKKGEKVTFTVENPNLWSAENPFLYNLVISTKDEKILQRVGIRTVEVKGRRFLVNGKAIKLYGVNRHDFHPDKGCAVSLDDIKKDLTLMKKLNVNAIRTSHYPSCPEFYGLCDEMGFYVISESDLETHGVIFISHFDTKDSFNKLFGRIAYDKKFEKPIVERQLCNVLVNRNSPSIIMWSLGNESGYGRNFVKAKNAVSALDDRPVHYESIVYLDEKDYEKYYYSDVVDVSSRMYASIEWIRDKYLPNKKDNKPFILCEYAHAMGNGPGDLKDYNDLFEKHDCLMGGCIWEWKDHGVRQNGVLNYGGDLGEPFSDGNFCIDGIVSPDCEVKSASLEMKKVFQPIRFEQVEGGITLYNKNFFKSLVGKIVIEYKEFGKLIDKTEIMAEVSPRTTIFVESKYSQTVNVYFVAKLFDQDHIIASEGFYDQTYVGKTIEYKSVLTDNSGYVIADSDKTKYSVNKKNAEMKISSEIFGGEINCDFVINRAPIDNDRYILARWKEQGLTTCYHEMRSPEITANQIKYVGQFVNGGYKPFLRYNCVLTFGEEGFTVSADWTATDGLAYVPRFGLRLKLPNSFAGLKYCAYGDGESYIDKHNYCKKDVYESQVSSEYCHYVKPQESGSHYLPDFAILTDGKSSIRAEGMQSFSATEYSIEELAKKTHDHELKKDGYTHFILDFAMSGLGSGSCGPWLAEQYRLPMQGKGCIKVFFEK